MPTKQARRPARTGPPRIACVRNLRLGGLPAGLPPLSGEAASIAAGDSLAAWESLVAAAESADALLLTGRMLDSGADLRAERALQSGLERLDAADCVVLAYTDESLPDNLPLTQLAPNKPSETELPRGDQPIAVVRLLAGRATFPMPDGLPTLGVRINGAADAGAAEEGGCDALFVDTDDAPGTLITLPEAAGAGGVRYEPCGERPVRFFAPVLDLLEEPTDLVARLRNAAPRKTPGERLRIVNWTLRVGPWGDRLLNDHADAVAAALSDSRSRHFLVALPHPERFEDEEDGEPGEAAAFLEALSHFDPLGDADAGPALSGVAPDAERVRRLATRFAAPLLARS